MPRPLRIVWIFALVFAPAIVSRAQSPAAWTLMVFMSAKNNLECEALVNFAELANVQNPATQVFVELGKKGSCGEKWSGVRRFRVDAGTPPSAANGSLVTGDDADMSKGSSVAAFVKWVYAQEGTPARHHMLVMWGHGLGLTLQPLRNTSQSPSAGTEKIVSPDLRGFPPDVPLGDFRAIGYDESVGRYLHIRDLADALRSTGRKLDFLGFDSCLMAGVENAYAFRKIADNVLAAETTFPGQGWDYQRLLETLNMDLAPSDWANLFGGNAAYGRGDNHDNQTILSTFNQSQAKATASLVSDLGDKLQAQLDKSNPSDAKAFVQTLLSLRASLPQFKQSSNEAATVDLGELARRLIDSPAVGVPAQASAVKLYNLMRTQQFVFVNYAPEKSKAFGAAVFFPQTMSDFNAIGIDKQQSYDPATCKNKLPYEIAFVCEKPGWASFLKDLLTKAHALGAEAAP